MEDGYAEANILMEEVWAPASENDAEGIVVSSGKRMKRIALLVNGFPLKLEKGYAVERRHITRAEEKHLRSI